jgi:hypothetical protein
MRWVSPFVFVFMVRLLFLVLAMPFARWLSIGIGRSYLLMMLLSIFAFLA